MDTAAEPRPGEEGFDGFRMRLPEDCLEYMLFVVGDKSASDLPSLETVRKAADQKLDQLARDYIWQRDPFRLETRSQKGLGLPYLYGTTHYGDSVEDEWLIVYLLRELSKSFPHLWIRVSDSDGEFLLIEAAKVTPKWLTPENDANRVWIHDGRLLIIPLSNPDPSHPAADSAPLSLAEAIQTIRTAPSSLIHSPLIEAEAFYRLEKYPGQITAWLHHALVTIPRKLAYILHARPKSVAPATEAFYLRDPRSLKPILSASAAPAPGSASASSPSSSATAADLIFPPIDLVTVSVRFTRVLYAQLKSQHFPPPPAWRGALRSVVEGGGLEADHTTTTAAAAGTATPGTNAEGSSENLQRRLARLELGMKLTTGFEMLARTAHDSASRVVREVGLLLEDLAEDGGDRALPSDEEIQGWEGVEREDDDSWMDIDYRDFERELDGAAAGRRGQPGDGAGFGDAAAQADLRKIVSRFEAFLNDETAGIEGAEIDEMDRDNDSTEEESEEGSDEDEDKEVSFDEEQFARMMREMMGLPADEASGQGKAKQKAVDESAAESDEEEEEEIRKLAEQMESELRDMARWTLIRSPRLRRKQVEPQEEEEDGEGSDEEVDIDYNLAKNLLESFKSQAGMAGPAGNLLGLMGVRLPRDEEDSDDDQK
ncbi:f86c3bfb-0f75-4ec3-834a-4049ff40c227 [Thermothielavioides terrestris]|uniref:F86c3bfb-0f75-4ec3-834a-4049ff40c227 n=1 Tax=Thermothielavioides terrestris TaxID=2587410 RepID=A0A3S4ATU0_9PEZI|nr:f86c3bfb-0f75-4ec3-834a-4049ff40c227 [Thermothielavioides terrestris]